jgi:regulator of RNase E activity RraA
MTDDHLLPRCERIAWSDALDEFEIQGVVAGISQRSGRGRFAAYAVTAREVAGPPRTFARREFAVGNLIASVGRGQRRLWTPRAQISTFGGLATLAASLRGVAAVVIDGGCRDIEEIRATNLWLGSRFVTPTSGKTRISVESIGEAVQLGACWFKPATSSWSMRPESSSCRAPKSPPFSPRPKPFLKKTD